MSPLRNDFPNSVPGLATQCGASIPKIPNMLTAESSDARWTAFLAHDASARFIVAVKTTGIYCRPACPARRPNRENVEFFDSPLQAAAAGYRACKRCRPDEPSADGPLVGRLKSLVRAGGRVTEGDLASIGVDPSTARRNFKKATGQTFAGWQRAFRNRNAANALSAATFDSPLGRMTAIVGDDALLMLNFVDSKYTPAVGAKIAKRFGVGDTLAEIIKHSDDKLHPILRQTRQQIDEYFTGTRQHFDIPLDPPELPFNRLAWEALINIPYGEVRSYGQQARAIGRPTAFRAVARANATNLIAIILPCHRVVGSNGTLTGYAGGLHRKQWLLEHERAVLAKSQS